MVGNLQWAEMFDILQNNMLISPEYIPRSEVVANFLCQLDLTPWGDFVFRYMLEYLNYFYPVLTYEKLVFTEVLGIHPQVVRHSQIHFSNLLTYPRGYLQSESEIGESISVEFVEYISRVRVNKFGDLRLSVPQTSF